MSEVASAYVSLLPSAKGFGRRTESILNGELGGTGDRVGRSLGGKITGGIDKTLKLAAAGVGFAAGGLLSVAFAKGFGRLNAIEQAEAKLGALGHSAKSVAAIMDNALASVKGTAFGLGDAASVAAGVVAAGIQPGKRLETVLKTVANSAALAGVEMGEMGAIFNKAAASNKVQGEILAQLGDAGIPVLQFLAKEMKVSAAEVSKLASAGAIDFDTFERAMRKGVGPAAVAMGQTFSGTLANVKAALGRLGAKALAPVFETLPGILNKGMVALDAFSPAVERMAGQVSQGFGKLAAALKSVDWQAILGKLGAAFEKVRGPAKRVIDFLTGLDWRGLAAATGGSIAGIVSTVMGADWSGVKTVLSTLWGALQPVLEVSFAGLIKAVEVVGPVVSTVFGAATSTINLLVDAVQNPLVQAGLAGITAALGLLAIPIAVVNAQMLLMIARAGIVSAATAAWTAITGAASAAQGLLNVVLAANPLGLLVIALVAIGVALVVAYKKSDTFRAIVDKAFAVVKQAAKSVANFFTTKVPAAFQRVKDAAGKALGWVKGNWPKILAVLTGPVGIAVALIVKHWDKIKAGAQKMWDGTKAVFAKLLTWMANLPGKILGKLGDLGSLLKDAGRKVIEGFWSGLKEKWASVQNWLGDVTSKIPKLKGPPRKDARLLEPAGRLVMGGFQKGLEAGFGGVEKVLAKTTDRVAKSGKAAIAAMKKRLAGLKSELDRTLGKIDLFKSIRDQVRDAFSPDLFSGSLADFLRDTAAQKAMNRTVKVAAAKLRGLKVDDKFLTALMSSGNGQLITQMAAMTPAAIKKAQKDWLAVQASASQLGTKTAEYAVGEGLKSLTSEARELNRQIKTIDKRIGKAVAREVNRSGQKGKRNRR